MDTVKKKHFILGWFLALSGSIAYSGDMGAASYYSGKTYVGVFGGGGGLSTNSIRQYGTAFFTEAAGGPLAVDALGASKSMAVGAVGGQIGFAWLNSLSEQVSMLPAVELEGFYLGKASVESVDLHNETTRLDEHDFHVTYPMNSGVFVVNAMLNSTYSLFNKFRPYLGLGLGTAVVSVSGANSEQINPVEVGVNHYNSNTSDTALAFAAQPKVGFHMDLNSRVRAFAEYRFVYLSRTTYTFGSTVYETHAPTSAWSVSIGSQYYNLGTVGIQFDV